jgi:putative intracellular protease/amidase
LRASDSAGGKAEIRGSAAVEAVWPTTLERTVPFLVEDELLRLGATFEKPANWQPLSVVDGRLITGQNPASSTATAQALVKFLGERAAHTSA